MNQQSLVLTRQTDIFTSSNKNPLRSLLEYKFKNEKLVYNTLFIKDKHGEFTSEYKSLVADYYTIF